MPAAERIGVESYFGISDFTKNAGIYENTLHNLGQVSEQFGRRVEKSTAGADKATNQYLTNTRKGAKEAESTWKMFSQSMIGQVAKMRATFDAAKFAVNAFVGPFKQFIALGTEAVALERTRERFRDMVGGVEEYTAALEEMREATRGQISDAQLIDSAFMILRRGYTDTAASAALLARNIQLTAQMAGQVPSPDAAMQVFSLMMANQSKMRLDAFGLTIEQVDARIEHLQETMGATSEEAFKMAVIQLLDEQVGDLGLTVETATTKLEKMKVQFTNLGDGIKTIIVPYFEDFVDVVTIGSGDISGALDFIKGSVAAIAGAIRGAAATFGEVVQAFVMGGMAIKEAFAGNIEASQAFAASAVESVKKVLTMQPFIGSINQEMQRMFGETGDAAEEMADTSAQALGEVEQAWNDLEAAMKSYEDDLAKVQEEMAKQTAKEARDAIYAVQDAAIEAARRREDIARQTAKQIMAIENQLAAATAQAYTNYQQTIRNIEKQNVDARLQIEEDYQKRKRDIMRNYAVSAERAIRERDALALSEARNQRDLELSEAEEQRNEQMASAQKAYNDQVQSAKEALEQQLQAAKDAYNQQMIELRNSLKEQEEEYRLAQQRKQEDDERNRAREEGERKAALGSKMTDIYLSHQEELTEAQRHYAALTGELQRYYANVVQYYAAIAQIQGSSQGIYRGAGGMVQGYQQVGGYAMTPGVYVRGESGKEFVMNNSTTRMMERGLGGGITQLDLQRLASSLSTGGATTTVNHNVSGEISGAISVAVTQGIKGMEGRLLASMNRNMRELFKVRR